MTKTEIVRLGMKFDKLRWEKENEFNTCVVETYKYRGEQRTRKVHKFTEEGRKAFEILTTEKVFICPECKELQTWNELESWLVETEEEYVNDLCPCGCCYEDSMGEDL